MEQNNIGRFISAKRREKNLTQEQLAEKIGVTNKTISKWENDKCMPDYSIVIAWHGRWLVLRRCIRCVQKRLTAPTYRIDHTKRGLTKKSSALKICVGGSIEKPNRLKSS